jgi:hypothetical protein
VIVYAVVDDALSPDFPLGIELEVFIRREDAERFVAEVRGDDHQMAAKLRIEEQEPEQVERRSGKGVPALPGVTMLTGAGEPGWIGAFSGSIAPTAAW